MHFLIATFLGLGGGTDDEARRLYTAMKERIASAKAVSIRFEASIEEAGRPRASMKGSVWIASKGRFRGEIERGEPGETRKMKWISDGTETVMNRESGEWGKRESVPPGATRRMREGLIQGGVTTLVLFLWPLRESDGPSKVEGLRLVRKETVGGRQCAVVGYTLRVLNRRRAIGVEVWVDSATSLPVKRRLIPQEKARKIVIEETYTKFDVDTNPSEKLFRLP